MATIEERADEYRRDNYDKYEEISEYKLEEAYSTGAYEQRRIDIEKACEVIYKLVGQSVNFTVEKYDEKDAYRYDLMALDIQDALRKAFADED